MSMTSATIGTTASGSSGSTMPLPARSARGSSRRPAPAHPWMSAQLGAMRSSSKPSPIPTTSDTMTWCAGQVAPSIPKTPRSTGSFGSSRRPQRNGPRDRASPRLPKPNPRTDRVRRLRRMVTANLAAPIPLCRSDLYRLSATSTPMSAIRSCLARLICWRLCAKRSGETLGPICCATGRRMSGEDVV